MDHIALLCLCAAASACLLLLSERAAPVKGASLSTQATTIAQVLVYMFDEEKISLKVLKMVVGPAQPEVRREHEKAWPYMRMESWAGPGPYFF